MSVPGDESPARLPGRGYMRASHADRDRVIDALQDAFVQGRLTKDEFDSRLDQALASRTHADLAPLTADLPTLPPAARPPRPASQARRPVPARPRSTAVRNGSRVIATSTLVTGSVWAVALLSQSDSPVLAAVIWTVTFAWFGAVLLAVSAMLESRMQKRSGLNPS
jgi:Domain of unknown function (DUF1707)